MGEDFSSRLSCWLATGALSVRTVYQALKACERRDGASEGSGWLFFELLWREHFRLLHLKHGRRLYRASGLPGRVRPVTDDRALEVWRLAQTGEPLVDAGMRELAASGFLSNRMRQIVASYLVYALGGDWRGGAAWFESCLLDYDVYSNQGNWLYIAGLGTDPRGGRHFNVQRQTEQHDPDGRYRALWTDGAAGGQ